MFFMPYAIDAVFVEQAGAGDEGGSRTCRPWRVVWWARGARDCLELRAGAAAESGTQAGDELRLIEIETRLDLARHRKSVDGLASGMHAARTRTPPASPWW